VREVREVMVMRWVGEVMRAMVIITNGGLEHDDGGGEDDADEEDHIRSVRIRVILGVCNLGLV